MNEERRLKDIAFELHGYSLSEMTDAEKRIYAILDEAGIMTTNHELGIVILTPPPKKEKP